MPTKMTPCYLCLGGSWFNLSEHVNFQNDVFPSLINEEVLLKVERGVWCALSAATNTGPNSS